MSFPIPPIKHWSITYQHHGLYSIPFFFFPILWLRIILYPYHYPYPYLYYLARLFIIPKWQISNLPTDNSWMNSRFHFVRFQNEPHSKTRARKKDFFGGELWIYIEFILLILFVIVFRLYWKKRGIFCEKEQRKCDHQRLRSTETPIWRKVTQRMLPLLYPYHRHLFGRMVVKLVVVMVILRLNMSIQENRAIQEIA